MGIDAPACETLKNNPTKSKKFIKTHNPMKINGF